MKRKSHTIRFTLVLFLFLMMGAVTKCSSINAAGSRPTPKQANLAAPQILVANIPFDDIPRTLKWSPNGLYIAMGGCTRSMPDFEKNVEEILVVSVASRRIVSRMKTSYQGTEKFEWAKNGALWIPSGDGWDVYSAPFVKKAHVSARLPKAVQSKIKQEKAGIEAFDPNSGVAVVVPQQQEYYANQQEQYKVQVWKQGRRLYDAQLKPRHRGQSRGLNSFRFSPDGTQLAITVTGWIGYEQEGTEELWVLDVKTGKLRFLHSGKVGEGIWDYPVQSAQPAWSKDSKTIVFGDAEFGVEEMELHSGKRKQILAAGRGGIDIRLSPSGSWLGFYVNDSSGAAGSSTAPMIVTSRDGKSQARIPAKDAAWSMGAWNWHPHKDTLAWVAPKKFNGPNPLYIWDIKVKNPTPQN